MGAKEQIKEVIISRLDLYIINRVKELREKKNISQDNLSVRMGFSEKFVGSVENPTLGAKYNIRHLNLLAKSLDCTLWDLLPKEPFDDDLVKVKIKRSKGINKDGSKSKRTQIEIVDIQPLKRNV
ncbi:helix-turn-helix transcriptional regulator [Fulvivirgaceae bacterium PWU4]|uniref:Helix-turn-helix transcriptional regulator n=1 Tax=Chryseosolibacter histidini TaxID=2782349 RepID=A0AAP2GMR1_9BACT|nr:helix-turn-helix transcriptional regulator [Chryseosolibacter histidini]MBT1696070.1 helix-turn-helix transcriptional regulator [Chryseosolibacter histidini]